MMLPSLSITYCDVFIESPSVSDQCKMDVKEQTIKNRREKLKQLCVHLRIEQIFNVKA